MYNKTIIVLLIKKKKKTELQQKDTDESPFHVKNLCVQTKKMITKKYLILSWYIFFFLR